ncbi:hypothetical protein INR49_003370 [Caranx melampygus]|nr:hypothetical protein INR49_003370 [Caranx melampygus]
MSLTAASSGFVLVLLLTLPVIQGQNDWRLTCAPTQICAVVGSTVDISCSYRDPDWRTDDDTTAVERLWFTKSTGTEPVDLRADSEHSGRVQYLCGDNDCTLTITDLRESDSAVYKLSLTTNKAGEKHTGEAGVTLSVTGEPVMIMNIIKLTLMLLMLITLVVFSLWTRKKKTLSSNPEPKEAVEMMEVDSGPVYEDVTTAAQTEDREEQEDLICAVVGSTVDISCSYRDPDWRTDDDTTAVERLWFTKSTGTEPVDLRADSEHSGRVQYLCGDNDCTLTITDLRESDSAVYKLSLTTNKAGEKHTGEAGVTLSVTGLQVKMGSYTSYSSGYWAELSVSAVVVHLIILPSLGTRMDRKLGEKHLHFQTSASKFCNTVIYTDRRICASKGSSVEISCIYNSYYDVKSNFWFSPERSRRWQNPSEPEDLSKDSEYSGRVQVVETETGRSTLRITDLTETDSAHYHFTFKVGSFEWRSSLPATTLTVTALELQVTRTMTVHQFYTEAELKCLSSCSPADGLSYIWIRNGEKIMKEGSSYTDRFSPGDVVSCAVKGHESHALPQKKRNPSEPGARPDNPEQKGDDEGEGGGVVYASVTFSQNPKHCVYSNVGAARPRIQKDEEEVEYSVVRVRAPGIRTPGMNRLLCTAPSTKSAERSGSLQPSSCGFITSSRSEFSGVKPVGRLMSRTTILTSLGPKALLSVTSCDFIIQSHVIIPPLFPVRSLEPAPAGQR